MNGRFVERARELLARPGWGPRAAVFVALVLLIPSLFTGLLVDDLWHRIYLTRDPRWGPVPRAAWDLFAFYDSDAPRRDWMIEQGIGIWWTDPAIRLAFFRPLSSLTHALDYALWPRSPLLMHLHSAAWYALLVGAVAALYARVFRQRQVAALGAILFAMDYNHGIPAAWLANRNAVIAAALGVLALLAHDRARASRDARVGALAVGLFAVSLLAGESGVSTLAYLFAWAVFMDEDTLTRRARSLVPYGVVTVVWALLYRAGGYGASHSGMYIDPSQDPMAFVKGAASNALLLIASEWGSVSPDVLVVAPWLTPGFLASAAFFVALAVGALVPALKDDRGARTLVLGGVLAVLPACATMPGSRLLTLPSMGLVGAAAAVLGGVIEREAWVPRTGARAWFVGAFALWAGGVRLALSPLLFVVVSLQMLLLHGTFERLAMTLPVGGAPLESQRVVYVNAPDASFTGYVSLIRQYRGMSVPGSFLVLAPGTREVELERRDESTLVVRQPDGLYRHATDVLMRSPSRPMRVGERVVLSDVTVEVTHVMDDGVPDEAVFRFARPLEDGRWRWVEWRGERFVGFTLPPVGGRVRLAGRMFKPA